MSKNKYTFMLAEHGEIPEIMELYRSHFGTPGCTWSEYYPTEEIVTEDIDNNSLYVLKEDGRIVAAAAAGSFDELGELSWTVENPCELARIGVRPELQNRGIGTIILNKVIDAVKSRGYGGIRMLVAKNNPAALAMYDKNGFERLGETHMYDVDFYCYQMKFGTAKE